MVRIGVYLAEPEGLPANRLAGATTAAVAGDGRRAGNLLEIGGESARSLEPAPDERSGGIEAVVDAGVQLQDRGLIPELAGDLAARGDEDGFGGEVNAGGSGRKCRGRIGFLHMPAQSRDHGGNTALGAWQYTIPPDASEQNIDWDRFLGSAPKRPFEPIRLFRWRNYRDYGTGVAGDLFVHLFSGLHTVVDSIGPSLVFAAGGLRYWKDGRDVPDVMLAVVDYPASASHPAFTSRVQVSRIRPRSMPHRLSYFPGSTRF